MAVTLESFKKFVGETDERYVKDDTLQHCLDEAIILVDNYVGDSVVPVTILDRAYKEVGAELFERIEAPTASNSGQFGEAGGSPMMRVTRDPLNPVYRMLQGWVLPF